MLPLYYWVVVFATLLGVAGCATAPPSSLPPHLGTPQLKSEASHPPIDLPAAGKTSPLKLSTVSETMPKVPGASPKKTQKPPESPTLTPTYDTKANISLNFEHVPLPTFINVVYAELLGLPVNIDPAVMARRDLVTIHTPEKQTPTQIEHIARLLLKSYGIAALDIGGLIRVVPDNGTVGYLPQIQRGAALPETPATLRPVFQMVELQAVRQTDVVNWLKTMFGDRVKLLEDASRNAVVLSGTSDNVAAAIEAIRVLDRPTMAGRSSLRITPAYWSVDDLSKRLQEILAAEGYSMPPSSYSPLQGGVRYPILLQPVPQVNSILVFAFSKKVLAHVREWAEKLDQPSKQTAGPGYFVYQVQNTSAEVLAKTLNSLFQSQPPALSTDKPTSTTAPAPTSGENGRIVVSKTNNALIFQMSNEEYGQLIRLLHALDQPSKSALVEVTVAEVTLSDDSQLGVEWLIKEAGIGSGLTGTLRGGTEGLTLRLVDSVGDVRLLVSALASSNRATILSTPRLMVRNGETASMQVGRDEPIVTSQQSSLSTTTDAGQATTGILQTVQYRNTGVLLTVTPSIHSGDMIDLDVQQEVSNVVPDEKGVANSPIIANKKLETKLTLQNGSTVLLGGLISTNDSTGNAGIPVLKDLPGVGKLFGTESNKNLRTELIVLITPYIISNSKEARAITQAFRSTLTTWSKEDEQQDPMH